MGVSKSLILRPSSSVFCARKEPFSALTTPFQGYQFDNLCRSGFDCREHGLYESGVSLRRQMRQRPLQRPKDHLL